MKKKPWGHKVVSIDTPDDCNTEVHVLVCANLPRDAQFRDIMGKVVPLVSDAVSSANPRPSGDIETVSASDFVSGWSDHRPQSPESSNFTLTKTGPSSAGLVFPSSEVLSLLYASLIWKADLPVTNFFRD